MSDSAILKANEVACAITRTEKNLWPVVAVRSILAGVGAGTLLVGASTAKPKTIQTGMAVGGALGAAMFGLWFYKMNKFAESTACAKPAAPSPPTTQGLGA